MSAGDFCPNEVTKFFQFCFVFIFWSDDYSPCIFSSLLPHNRLGQTFLSLFFISVSSFLDLELEYRRLIIVHFLCKILVFPFCAVCTHILRSQDLHHRALHVIWPSSKHIPPPCASVTCTTPSPFPHKLFKLQISCQQNRDNHWPYPETSGNQWLKMKTAAVDSCSEQANSRVCSGSKVGETWTASPSWRMRRDQRKGRRQQAPPWD